MLHRPVAEHIFLILGHTWDIWGVLYDLGRRHVGARPRFARAKKEPMVDANLLCLRRKRALQPDNGKGSKMTTMTLSTALLACCGIRTIQLNQMIRIDRRKSEHNRTAPLGIIAEMV